MISHTALAEFRTTADVRIAYFRTDLFVSRSPRLGSQPLPSSCSDPSYRSSILKFCAVCRNSKVCAGIRKSPPARTGSSNTLPPAEQSRASLPNPHVRYPHEFICSESKCIVEAVKGQGPRQASSGVHSVNTSVETMCQAEQAL